MQKISQFVKTKRKNLKLTQEELAQKSGVGLRFLRELEQGKITLRLDKVNQLLDMFSSEVGVLERNTHNFLIIFQIPLHIFESERYVAQFGRASTYHVEGRRFDACLIFHYNMRKCSLTGKTQTG